MSDLVTRLGSYTQADVVRACPHQALHTMREAVDEIERLRASLAKLTEALQLPLLFHRAGPWDDSKRLAWLRITGSEEATTKAMCDHLRAVLAEIEKKEK